eukprot:31174-Pelagococcus_subviridis.AAC.1
MKSPAGRPCGTPSPSSQNRVNPARPRAACAAPTTSVAHLARHRFRRRAAFWLSLPEPPPPPPPPPSPSLPSSSLPLPSSSSSPTPTGPRISVIGRLKYALSAATSTNELGTFGRAAASANASLTRIARKYASESRRDGSSLASATRRIARRQLSSGAPDGSALDRSNLEPLIAATIAASSALGETSSARTPAGGRDAPPLGGGDAASRARSSSSSTLAIFAAAPRRRCVAVSFACDFPSDRIPRRSTAATESASRVVEEPFDAPAAASFSRA